MTAPRAGRRRNIEDGITETEFAYLIGSPKPEAADPGDWWALQYDCQVFRENRPTIADLWTEYGALVLRRWTAEHPGTRPDCWWEFEAPRLPVGQWPGYWYDGTFAVPRLHIGGAGVASHEASAYCPRFRRGVHRDWLFTDPARPLRFEAEATYLDRLDLFLPGERARVPASGWAPWSLDDPDPTLTDDHL